MNEIINSVAVTLILLLLTGCVDPISDNDETDINSENISVIEDVPYEILEETPAIVLPVVDDESTLLDELLGDDSENNSDIDEDLYGYISSSEASTFYSGFLDIINEINELLSLDTVESGNVSTYSSAEVDYQLTKSINGPEENIVSSTNFYNYEYGSYTINGNIISTYTINITDDSISNIYTAGEIILISETESFLVKLNIPTSIKINNIKVLL